MSAVRMVAYGVLVMKHKDTTHSEFDSGKLAREDFERDELRKLVNDELRRYGLLMARDVVPHKNRFRTKANAHVLYGQLYGPSNNPGFIGRTVLHAGDFKECCVVAAKILDELDAAQVPDVKT